MTINNIVNSVLAEGRHLLYEDEAGALLKEAGIPVNPCRVAVDEDTAIGVAREIGFPVVLKVRSQAIPHKTEVGGVQLGLTDPEDVRRAFFQIMDKALVIDPAAQVTVQPMAASGVELLIGMTTDPQFGPVMAFGLGGTLLELFNDTTFRLIPLLEKDAADMLDSIKGDAILQGYRGQPPVDKDAIIKMILNFSKLVESTPRIKEIDINPVLAYPDGALAVDARIFVY